MKNNKLIKSSGIIHIVAGSVVAFFSVVLFLGDLILRSFLDTVAIGGNIYIYSTSYIAFFLFTGIYLLITGIMQLKLNNNNLNEQKNFILVDQIICYVMGGITLLSGFRLIGIAGLAIIACGILLSIYLYQTKVNTENNNINTLKTIVPNNENAESFYTNNLEGCDKNGTKVVNKSANDFTQYNIENIDQKQNIANEDFIYIEQLKRLHKLLKCNIITMDELEIIKSNIRKNIKKDQEEKFND